MIRMTIWIPEWNSDDTIQIEDTKVGYYDESVIGIPTVFAMQEMHLNPTWNATT